MRERSKERLSLYQNGSSSSCRMCALLAFLGPEEVSDSFLVIDSQAPYKCDGNQFVGTPESVRFCHDTDGKTLMYVNDTGITLGGEHKSVSSDQCT